MFNTTSVNADKRRAQRRHEDKTFTIFLTLVAGTAIS